MMHIEFVTGVAGARFAYEAGDKVTLDDKIARAFVTAGQARECAEGEAAVDSAPETAMAPRARGRGRRLFA